MVALPVAVKQLAEVCLAEVSGVVEHDVENHLHASLVGGVDERLEGDVLRLVAVVYFAEVGCVISVIVVARGVFYYRGNPDGGEAESLDVVKLLNKALEVAAPSGVAVVVLLAVLALHVVWLVAVVETGCHHEVDCFVTEIVAVSDE